MSIGIHLSRHECVFARERSGILVGSDSVHETSMSDNFRVFKKDSNEDSLVSFCCDSDV